MKTPKVGEVWAVRRTTETWTVLEVHHDEVMIQRESDIVRVWPDVFAANFKLYAPPAVKVKVPCYMCGTAIEKTQSEVSSSKTGQFYCGRECYNWFQRRFRVEHAQRIAAWRANGGVQTAQRPQHPLSTQAMINNGRRMMLVNKEQNRRLAVSNKMRRVARSGRPVVPPPLPVPAAPTRFVEDIDQRDDPRFCRRRA